MNCEGLLRDRGPNREVPSGCAGGHGDDHRHVHGAHGAEHANPLVVLHPYGLYIVVISGIPSNMSCSPSACQPVKVKPNLGSS